MAKPSRLQPLARAVLRTQSDQRLVALVRDGTEAAYEEIVRRYRAPLIAFAAAYGPPDPEDVVQESLIRSWEALRESTGDMHLKAWLYAIVRNRALNARRDSRIHEPLGQEIDGVPQPSEIVLTNDELQRAVAAIGALPATQREALVRSALEGHTHEQIAASIGSSPGAVRQLIFRARATVRHGVGAILPLPLVALLVEAGAGGAGAAAGSAAAAGGGSLITKTAVAAAIGAVAIGSGAAIQQAGTSDRDNDRAASAEASPAPGQGPGLGAGAQPTQPTAADGVRSSTAESGDDRGGLSSGEDRDRSGEDGDSSGEGSGDATSASSGPGPAGDDPGSGSSGPGSGDREPAEDADSSGSSDSSGSGTSGTSGSESSGSGSSGSGSDNSGSGSGSSGSGGGDDTVTIVPEVDSSGAGGGGDVTETTVPEVDSSGPGGGGSTSSGSGSGGWEPEPDDS